MMQDSSNGMFRLDGAVAVVTGGASGIGQAVAEMFTSHGACVHILDLNESEAESVVAGICDTGGEAKAHHCNVSDWEDVERVFHDITAEGPVDILVNSAGIPHVGKLENTTQEDFNRIYQVNVRGVFNCMRACIESMKSNHRGVILNMASNASLHMVRSQFWAGTSGSWRTRASLWRNTSHWPSVSIPGRMPRAPGPSLPGSPARNTW